MLKYIKIGPDNIKISLYIELDKAMCREFSTRKPDKFKIVG